MKRDKSNSHYIIFILALYLLPFFIGGCSGGQIVKKDVKVTPWATYLYNKERQGNTDDTILSPLKLARDFRIARGIRFFPIYEPKQYSSPAIVDNVIYIGSADKFFYAIDLSKGKRIWEFKTTGAVESSPTVADGMVYFGTNDGKFYCLNGRDGKEIWRFQANTEIISSPIVAKKVIYFNSADDKLYALNAETGEKLWQYNRRYVKGIVKRMFASPTLYNDKIYSNFSDGTIVAVEKSSGREVWNKKIEGKDEIGFVRATPTVNDGLVYLINGDGYTVAFDAENGEERWKFDIIRAVNFVLGQNHIFITGYDGRIVAMKKNSGEIIWRRKVSNGVPASIVISDNYLIVASNYESETFFSSISGSYIDIFEIETGKRVWDEKIDSTTSTSLAVAYNHLFFVTDRGFLRIYTSSQ